MLATHEGRVSVTAVIPAHNEQAYIARITRQVLQDAWHGQIVLDEVILVDDASTDGTGGIAASLAQEDSRVRVITHAERSGKNAGMRSGMAACRSDIIAFLDADVSLGPHCLTRTVRLLANNPALAASSCLIEPLPARSLRERAARFQTFFAGALRDYGHGPLLWRVYAVRITAIKDLALPDNQYDDIYIPRWLRNHGYRLTVQRQGTAYVRSATGLRDFAKQYVRDAQALRSLNCGLPSIHPTTPGFNRVAGIRSAARAAQREPLGFMLAILWRIVIWTTPRWRWLPVVDLSRHDTSASTKDLGL